MNQISTKYIRFENLKGLSPNKRMVGRSQR